MAHFFAQELFQSLNSRHCFHSQCHGLEISWQDSLHSHVCNQSNCELRADTFYPFLLRLVFLGWGGTRCCIWSLLLLLHVLLQDCALQKLVVLLLIEILEAFGIKFSTLLQNLLEVVLLLISHHGNIGSGASNALTLAVPDYWLRAISSCCRLWCTNCLSLRLAAKDVGSGDGEAPQVCGDVVGACVSLVGYSLFKLLLLLLALRVHNAEFEVLAPLRLEDELLAVWALLVAF